ncbi:MAG: membrane protein required for colicin V production [Pseudohongiellaceae bacterium]|jgi:membrane protein required for colicin V production
MNEVDAVILVVIGLSCLFGLWRGLIKEVLSLVTWVAALALARLYSDDLGALLTNLIANEAARLVAAFALIFVVVMMLGTLINHLLSKLLTITGLKIADRIFGGVFGIARGTVIIIVILFIVGPFVNEQERWQQSQLIPYGLQLIDYTQGYIGVSDVGNELQPEI